MYFDWRLWQLTRGLRGWIAFAIFLGLVAAVVGIARFAILGVLLSHVFSGAGLIGEGTAARDGSSTAVSPFTGDRVNRFLHVSSSAADLVIVDWFTRRGDG